MSKKIKISKKKLSKLFKHCAEREHLLQDNVKLSYENEKLRKGNADLQKKHGDIIEDFHKLENLCNITNLSLSFPKPEHSELPPLLTVEHGDGTTTSVPSTGSDSLSMRHDVMRATLLRIFPSETINALFEKCDEASDKLEEFLDDCCCDCDCENCEGCEDCNDCEACENEYCDGYCETCSEDGCPENPEHVEV